MSDEDNPVYMDIIEGDCPLGTPLYWSEWRAALADPCIYNGGVVTLHFPYIGKSATY